MAESVTSDDQVDILGRGSTPAAIAKHIRQLLGEGRLQDARDLVAKALNIHPADDELLGLQRVIAPGQVERKSGHYPDRKAEFAWIARNRSHYQGKWVALIGEQVIGMEDDAHVLLSKIKQQNLAETPLVHHLI